MMHIEVIGTIGEAKAEEMKQKTVIVIDVLRATSTMITVLSRGCRGIIPVETLQEANEWHQDGDLLIGERFCQKIPGFHYGNSPLEFLQANLQGKRVIMTTTNGTRGIQKACKGKHVLVGSLLNGKACAQIAAGFGQDIVIICSGTEDDFSLEDGLCAGQIADELMAWCGETNVTLNDFGIAMRNSFLQVKDDIEQALFFCRNGNRLNELGFGPDIRYCAQMNITEIVPIMDSSIMVIHRKQPNPTF
jgi:2-phosphosulfolactate phosphatase